VTGRQWDLAELAQGLPIVFVLEADERAIQMEIGLGRRRRRLRIPAAHRSARFQPAGRGRRQRKAYGDYHKGRTYQGGRQTYIGIHFLLVGSDAG